MSHLILVLFLSIPTYISAQFNSPCPNLFTYDNIGADSWSGTLRVTLDTELSGIWLRTIYDRPFNELTSDFGEVVQREPTDFLIRRPSPKVDAGSTLQVRITAKNNPVLGAPQLLGFRLNAKTVCPENGVIPPPPPIESLQALSGNLESGALESPCPSLFTYEPLTPEGNRWYGQIKVTSDLDLSGVWMRVVLDRPPVDFGTEFGTAEQKEISEFLVKNPKHKVNSGDSLQFRVWADFIPGETPPKLLGFRLNARTVCPTDGVIKKPEAELPVSPCPNIFTYESRGPEKDRWNAALNLGTDSDLSGVWIRIVFDKPITDLGTDFGEANRRGDNDFLVKNPKHALKIGESLKLRVTPQFNPNDSPPKLVEIRLNARTVCSSGIKVETTTAAVAQQLISPCPQLFTYEPPGTENDRWYGNVNLVTTKELTGVWIRVILDRQSIQLGNWFGEVRTDDNIVYIIHRRDYKLSPGATLPLRFFIRYTANEPVPKLKEIKLNGETFCPVSGINPNAVGIQTQSPNSLTTARPSGGGNFPPKPDWGGGWKPPVATAGPDVECGVVATQPIPLLWGGTITDVGQYPWHGALYYTAGSTPQYYCGAVLISLSHVLTAAHCVADRGSTNVINPSQVQVWLGKYLFSSNNRGVQHMQIGNIIIHPQYDSSNFTNDIALIHLSRPAEYSDVVRPVCLWSESTDLSSVENREGTVVGWGYDNNGQVTDKLLKAVMPVVSHRKCIWSNKQFYKRVVNDGNFCAGFRNGTSVCTGDSGGGLVFPTSNSRWQLRGLVSLSVALQDSDKACDTSHYVVFTDVAKYLPWIAQARRNYTGMLPLKSLMAGEVRFQRNSNLTQSRNASELPFCKNINEVANCYEECQKSSSPSLCMFNHLVCKIFRSFNY